MDARGLLDIAVRYIRAQEAESFSGIGQGALVETPGQFDAALRTYIAEAAQTN